MLASTLKPASGDHCLWHGKPFTQSPSEKTFQCFLWWKFWLFPGLFTFFGILLLLWIPGPSLWFLLILGYRSIEEFLSLLSELRLLVLWELGLLLRLLLLQLQLLRWLRPGGRTSICPPQFWHRWWKRGIGEVNSFYWSEIFWAGHVLPWRWTRLRGRGRRSSTSSTSPPATTPLPWRGAELFGEWKILSF